VAIASVPVASRSESGHPGFGMIMGEQGVEVGCRLEGNADAHGVVSMSPIFLPVKLFLN
jgi:hypothetical protein